MTLNPFLRQSLGAADNTLNFRQIIDSGRSVIINLALPHHDARRLLGCLLTVGMETAALSRAGTPGKRQSHHLILDEFSQFMAQSEHALTRMLSETRKAHVHTLRTTHITEHIARRTDIKTVQGNAGHASLATTNFYARYVKEAQIRAMQENAL